MKKKEMVYKDDVIRIINDYLNCDIQTKYTALRNIESIVKDMKDVNPNKSNA